MPEERMEVIIEEIRYWRKSQLLPEVYCDYLLALYTKGENGSEDLNNTSTRNKTTVSLAIQLILLLFTIPFSLLVMSSSLLFIGKLFVLLSLMGYAGWTLYHFKQRGMMYGHISLMILFLLVLLSSVFMNQYFDLEQWTISGVIIGNVFVWFIVGLKWRISYLIITSIFGIFMTIVFYFMSGYPISL